MSDRRPNRSQQGTSLSGTIVFVLGRAADPAIQYTLFKGGYAAALLGKVGLRASPGMSLFGPGMGGLGPVPTLLVGMYGVAALRHIYWIFFTSAGNFPPRMAAPVAVFNWAMNAFNTLVAVYKLTSVPALVSAASAPATFSGWAGALGVYQWTGLALFTTGILAELLSEETRKTFKRNPTNKGEVDSTGLWSVVRHPNYAGYYLWRLGITLATGSPLAALVTAAVDFAMFYNSIPAIEAHMAGRYGRQWDEHVRSVPYKLLPGIF